MKVSACKQGFKNMVVNKDGLIEKRQAGSLHADDVCLMASNEQDLHMILITLVDALVNMVLVKKSQRWFV